MKDDIQRSFLTNAIVIISAILCVYLLSLLFLFNVSIVRPSQATNERVAKEVEAEFAHYKEGMARLVADEQIRAFLRGEGKSGEVNQLLYDFRNAQTFQSDFVLLDSEEEIVATSLYEGQKEQLQQSPVLREQMQQAEEHPFTGEYVNKRAFNAGQGGAYVFAAAVEEGKIVQVICCSCLNIPCRRLVSKLYLSPIHSIMPFFIATHSELAPLEN